MKRVFSNMWTNRIWIGIVAIMLVCLVAVANTPVGASPASKPQYQTVPLPTPTSEPAPLPTATPSNDEDDDEDPSDSDPEPTPEPPSLPGSSGGDGEAPDARVDEVIENVIGEVVVTTLNVREEPNADAALIGTLAAGDEVILLGRNEDGDWWVVCCAGEASQAGWASAQFVRPNIRRVDVNRSLPVVDSLEELLAANAIDAVSDEGGLTEAAGAQTILRLVIDQTPAYVRQGGEMVLRFTVVNDGEVEAQNVTLTDQLPPAFTYESVTVENDGSSQQRSGDDDAVIVQIDWPAIAPGEAVAADVTLTLVSDAGNGLVFDNLAVVGAENAGDVSGGISIGTAPTLLPDF